MSHRKPSPKRMPWLPMFAALVLLSGCATTPTADVAASSLGGRLLHGYLQPRTRALQSSTALLHTALQSYCARPAERERRDTVERQLREVVAAWARVELLRFGPLVEQNRLEHFFFWPDPRGVVQRQMRAVLTAADPALLRLPQLQQQSAAVQGLPALEYALYADDAQRSIAVAEAGGRYRCAFAATVAANLDQLAMQISRGWQDDAPLARQFAQPAAGHSVYRSADEVATEVLKTLSTALHATRDQKLLPALGEDAAAARGTLLPLHRSGLTAAYLAAGMEGLAAFHALGGFGESLPADARWIDAAVHEELERVREDLQLLTLPVSEAVTDGEQRDLLVHAALLLANTRTIVDEYLAPALGVNLGFNALDGD